MTIEMKAATFYLNCYLSRLLKSIQSYHTVCKNMSLRRHGGFNCYSKTGCFREFNSAGIHIGADLTHSLLESIFFPGNPLHDGAVLVHQNQIESAANVLPLSERYTGKRN